MYFSEGYNSCLPLLRAGPKNLRMGKRLKMIEGMVATDNVWS